MAQPGSSMSQLAALVGAELRLAGSDPEITDVIHDSRESGPGSLFVALTGASVDGHDYAAAALGMGASGVCLEKSLGIAPEMVVEETRSVLGPLAAQVHGQPSNDLGLIGVTGTNGKTTVTHYLHSLFTHAGERAGLIGTIGSRIGDRHIESRLTTPEASDLQRLLREMASEGVTQVAMEVSSHALSLGRVLGSRFTVAAFTNLSQDHLDFHGDMDSYRRAKESLFLDYEVGHRVVNIDDPVGLDLAGKLEDAVRVGAGGDVRYQVVSSDPGGNRVEIHSDWGVAVARIPVQGHFNVSNAVLALTCAVVAGLDFESAVDALGSVPPVPGRFETLRFEDAPTVVVDYAHTPAGIESAIHTARQMAHGRVIALVGAGGDRDRGKRPLMGRALGTADLAIVTTDNPRSEDPEVIAAEVSGGVIGPHRLVIDRRTAISEAIREGEVGDVVLILGRGHESHQDLGDGGQIPFSDAEVARRILESTTHETERGEART